jgi:hypothetical protein
VEVKGELMIGRLLLRLCRVAVHAHDTTETTSDSLLVLCCGCDDVFEMSQVSVELAITKSS